MTASITQSAEQLDALLLRARAADDPSLLVSALPYMAYVGIAIERDGDGVSGRMRYDEALIGDASIPALHGGTICALLESTAIFSVLWRAEKAVLPKTITLTVDYLRSGRPVDTICRASIVRQGRRICVVSVRAFQEDESKPIATAIVHVLVTSEGDD